MLKRLKNYTLHIGIGTLIVLVLWALATGRSAGNFESEVHANTEYREEHKEDIKQIPVMMEAISTLKEDVQYIRAGIDSLLKN